MENQHRRITGYRELSPREIDIMNEIKMQGAALEALILRVQKHTAAQWHATESYLPVEEEEAKMRAENNGELSDIPSGMERTPEAEVEAQRIMRAQPGRWTEIAQTDFQTGLMALTRAVAQPTSF